MILKNTKMFKLFAQSILYLKFEEVGNTDCRLDGQRYFTHCVPTQSNGYEINYNSNNSFDNTFFVSDESFFK